MRFAALGSGSEGNALLIEHQHTRILLDCGLTLKGCEQRLAALGLRGQDLTGIVVTHEHGDHISGVAPLAIKYQLPVWASYGTLNAVPHISARLPRLQPFDSHARFSIQSLEVHPFPVPHDATEPTQFVFSDGQFKLGVLTDLGRSTPYVEYMLNGLDALILECNHDVDLLAQSSYPAALKARIAGPLGHLSNHQAAQLLGRIDTSKLQHLIAAHLSQENNKPALVRDILSEKLSCTPDWIGISDQKMGFDWRQLQ